MKTLPRLSLHSRAYVILFVCLSVPLIATWYLVRYVNQNIFYSQKESHLMSMAQILDTRLSDGGYDAILRDAGALTATREQKIAVLNEALRGDTDEIASVSAGLGIGVYSRELDAILTYGPSGSFQNTVGSPISETHPGRLVMAENRRMVSMGTMVRGNIMNAMFPVVRGGAVIG
ncbi:MAG: hypothetical protein LBU58_10925, partial [Clostridiales bacterium]|nr:hypothetical protein [Clostridiales bacterium]